MDHQYDIAIIGSGISGAMLASILAKNQLRVILIDAGTHPRFAVGESMVPESAVLLEMLALRYGIPELAYPGNIANINKHIGTSAAGVKLAFAFAWNGRGQEQDPSQVVSTPVLAPEAHLFRQDVDAYYVALAARLGASVRQMAPIREMEFFDDGAVLHVGEGEQIKVRYVVDAAGYRSPLAALLGLRDGARPMQANTRSIFTHMVGVKTYEDVVATPPISGTPTHLGQSTLHHMFDCGWLWIIPFDNHPFSTNPLCSVGLQFDIGKHGPATSDPEGEFQRFIAQYPSIARHFEGAARVREWTVAPRLNYTSRATTGDRYCLLGHAVGFVDPLFSRGLVNTFESITRLVPVLLRAATEDRWQREDFLSLERYSLDVVRINDRLVANSYTAFTSFPLWNAWFRIWLSGSYIGVLRLRKLLSEYKATCDGDALDRSFEQASFSGHLSIESPHFEAMFDAACTAMESFAAGTLGRDETIKTLHQLYADNRAHLPLDFSDFSNRYLSRPTQEFAKSLLDWANHAPAGLAQKLQRGTQVAPVEFLDAYRWGDRLGLAAMADGARACGGATSVITSMPAPTEANVVGPDARSTHGNRAAS
ncbi:conserved hypothetical protein [Thiomonas sp. X19]|uniref:NAD(P)/FAD-dependent oxidoreductase n=1 Tax=Thiomonas sp. X19 TaxID=1050370 RepID=UPI000B7428AA|nr:tryptophan 7-halogenase [Thiomonas sp. X19]SCC93163.1 conserved hypothetical protein [Thiomonas sp. X19]